ncbi:hypothetical protein PAXRUDRAFT_124779, partial [Paxillus rubicundulus Ve08.2h10]
QRVAHAMFHFADPHPVNKVIRDGLYTCKDKLNPHKDRKEPTRCTHCQHWGHIAGNCNDNHDTCAICGHNHCTSDCISYKTHYCISCDTTNHSSNNRHCPTYIDKCTVLDTKHPENFMPYFPTDD